MRRYLIIFLAALASIALFFLAKYVLQKLTKKKSIFIASLISLSGFSVFILLSFMYLEHDAADPTYNYNPPSIKNGKMLEGKFSK
ncbi:hypothetical protein N8014_00485 [Pseudomonadota bacterium]|jgi:uncharacterized BrkB/YihY/UPF0761 family membrane protein|nr:hypothetical protein [Pseudomonadota bacterium]